MKRYLIDFFKFNDWANRKLLDTIKNIPDKEEPVKLFGHIIMAQNRWYNRITKKHDDSTQSWSGSVIPLDQLEGAWSDSLGKLIHILESGDETILENKIVFRRPSDSKDMIVKMQDIMLQLNYHSVGHRAQINRIIRLQGVTPPATDYILTVLKEA
jgi:uncharacterized damage-inducible protein DinB